eukprot:TRINITY_DN6816_c0_g1_i1.p1 TRINITY_DN6816_c0_g1~~TRINITY_DN6816_c0_g1_i1.p1  ORF type:complete len:1126 (-),score=259.00 TRINITY_DN6816_c0_g1_i1:29-3259(-)
MSKPSSYQDPFQILSDSLRTSDPYVARQQDLLPILKKFVENMSREKTHLQEACDIFCSLGRSWEAFLQHPRCVFLWEQYYPPVTNYGGSPTPIRSTQSYASISTTYYGEKTVYRVENASVDPPTGLSKLPEYNPRLSCDCVGLENQGATCYMNGLLQVLFHLSAFRRAVYLIPALKDLSVADENNVALAMQELFFDLQHSSTSVSTTNLTRSFGWSSSEAEIQHDATELYQILTDKLSEKMAGTPAEGELQKLFEGATVSMIKSHDGSFKKYTAAQPFTSLSMQVKNCRDLQASFMDMCKKQEMTGANKFDIGGGQLVDASISTVFSSLPPVLNLDLSRFSYDRDMTSKITDRFEFAVEIDLNDYMSETADKSIDQRYQLFAVLVHRGAGSGFGHYYAYIKVKENWICFNDTDVAVVPEEEAVSNNFGGVELRYWQKWSSQGMDPVAKAASAYRLVYIRKQDAPVLRDSVPQEDIPVYLHERQHQRAAREEEECERRLHKDQYIDVHVLSDMRQLETFANFGLPSGGCEKLTLRQTDTLAKLYTAVRESSCLTFAPFLWAMFTGPGVWAGRLLNNSAEFTLRDVFETRDNAWVLLTDGHHTCAAQHDWVDCAMQSPASFVRVETETTALARTMDAATLSDEDAVDSPIPFETQCARQTAKLVLKVYNPHERTLSVAAVKTVTSETTCEQIAEWYRQLLNSDRLCVWAEYDDPIPVTEWFHGPYNRDVMGMVLVGHVNVPAERINDLAAYRQYLYSPLVSVRPYGKLMRNDADYEMMMLMQQDWNYNTILEEIASAVTMRLQLNVPLCRDDLRLHGHSESLQEARIDTVSTYSSDLESVLKGPMGGVSPVLYWEIVVPYSSFGYYKPQQHCILVNIKWREPGGLLKKLHFNVPQTQLTETNLHAQLVQALGLADGTPVRLFQCTSDKTRAPLAPVSLLSSISISDDWIFAEQSPPEQTAAHLKATNSSLMAMLHMRTDRDEAFGMPEYYAVGEHETAMQFKNVMQVRLAAIPEEVTRWQVKLSLYGRTEPLQDGEEILTRARRMSSGSYSSPMPWIVFVHQDRGRHGRDQPQLVIRN